MMLNVTRFKRYTRKSRQPKKLMRIDLSIHENIWSDESISVGFGVCEYLKRLHVVQAQECRLFRKNVRFFLIKLVEKFRNDLQQNMG